MLDPEHLRDSLLDLDVFDAVCMCMALLWCVGLGLEYVCDLGLEAFASPA